MGKNFRQSTEVCVYKGNLHMMFCCASSCLGKGTFAEIRSGYGIAQSGKTDCLCADSAGTVQTTGGFVETIPDK